MVAKKVSIMPSNNKKMVSEPIENKGLSHCSDTMKNNGIIKGG
jgi:hypothetical protein